MRLASPDCPHCGHPPRLILDDGRQAVCGNHDCDVIMWDATVTPAELAEEVPEVVRFEPQRRT